MTLKTNTPGVIALERRSPRSRGRTTQRLRATVRTSPEISRHVEETELITSPERVQTIMRALCAHRAEGWARSISEPDPRPVAVKLDPQHRLLMEWTPVPLPPPLLIEVAGYNSVFRFQVEAATSLPNVGQLVRVRRRAQRRVPAPPRAFISFMHPQTQERVVRPLRDISYAGLGFCATGLTDALHPGLHLGDVQVEWKGGLPLRFIGTVSHVSRTPDGKAFTCGLRVHAQSPADVEAIQQQLDQLFYPTTRIGDVDADALWELYAGSGYFRLSDKSTAHFEPLRRQFKDATRKLARAPNIGVRVVRMTERGMEGSVSQTKVYDGTWVVYQLARHETGRPLWAAGSDVLRELHTRGYEHIQQDPNLRYLLSYVQDAARFSRLLQYDVPEHYVESGRACIFPFRALEAQFNAPAILPPDVEVASATNAEMHALLKVIQRSRPRMYVDAYDFTEDRFTLDGIRKQWSSAKLLRDRHVLVARRDGVARAAAILEACEDGVHLFGLLDVVRVFPLCSDGDLEFGTLLQAARSWYLARGKRRYVYFEETGDLQHLSGLQFSDMGSASITILPAQLLPELLERLHEVTAPTMPPEVPTERGT